MKKIIAIVLCLLFIIVSFGGCTEKNSEYILKYDIVNSNAITTQNKDGIFYILENPLKVDSPYGKVTVLSCHYEDEVGFVINWTLETNKPEEIEKMANDAEHSLYGKAYIKNKSLSLSGFGYAIREKKGQLGSTVFDLSSTYKYKHYPKHLFLELKILDVSLTIPLSEKQGYSIDSTEGRKIKDDTFIIEEFEGEVISYNNVVNDEKNIC